MTSRQEHSTSAIRGRDLPAMASPLPTDGPVDRLRRPRNLVCQPQVSRVAAAFSTTVFSCPIEARGTWLAWSRSRRVSMSLTSPRPALAPIENVQQALLTEARLLSNAGRAVRSARVEAHGPARRIEQSWAHSSIGVRTNIAARNIPFNRQTLIPIHMDDFDVSRGEHRGTPRCSGSRCLLIVFSVLSSANTCSSKRAATRLLPNDESGCSDPERLVC
jgi:hypothetical protein